MGVNTDSAHNFFCLLLAAPSGMGEGGDGCQCGFWNLKFFGERSEPSGVGGWYFGTVVQGVLQRGAQKFVTLCVVFVEFNVFLASFMLF